MSIDNQKAKLQKRDYALLALTLAIVATNWLWYQHYKAQEISLKTDVEAWLMQQVQISKLKTCIDEGIKPCDITPQTQK